MTALAEREHAVPPIPLLLRGEGFEAAHPTGANQYYRARYYDPKAGRFISEDPIRLRGGINFYAYVRNNPVNGVDPFGLETGNINKGFEGPYPPIIWPPHTPDPTGDVFDESRAQEAVNFPGVADPYGGGFRHCMSACLLKRRYGPAGNVMVFLWDKVHEDPNDANSRSDMAAEQKGISCAGGGGTCEKECLKEYPTRANGGNP